LIKGQTGRSGSKSRPDRAGQAFVGYLVGNEKRGTC
jgi:hypothetical protein